MGSSGVGKQIAIYRRRRGLSQVALAGLVGRSESWLSKVERGDRTVDRLPLLRNLADALRVDVETLSGLAAPSAVDTAVTRTDVNALREAFTAYDHLVATARPPRHDLRQLGQLVTRCHEHYQAASYDRLIERLPPLMVDADRHRRLAIGTPHQREAELAYVSTYIVAAKLVTKLGVTDLAVLAADRALNVAYSVDSEVVLGQATYQVSCSLLRAGQHAAAQAAASDVAEQLERRARTDRPEIVSVAGSLVLISAVVAARQADSPTAWSMLDRAERLARVLGRDGNQLWTAFGPTNVEIHKASVAAELGQAGEALRIAERIDAAALPTPLVSRRAQIHLDLARAYVLRRRDADATLHLMEVEGIAPQVIRHNSAVQDIVREMLSRGARSTTTALTQLAGRAGLLI